jgi:membrane-bound hydrogenase subunit beta
MPGTELNNFLQERFHEVVRNVITKRERRMFAETTTDKLVEVIRALKDWGMVNLGTITGLDSGEQFEIIYHLYDAQGLIFNLKVFIPRNDPKLPTVTTVFPGVFLYERELMDLFGIEVVGTPPGRHYPLPENWPSGQYPLRKDWKGLPPENNVEC